MGQRLCKLRSRYLSKGRLRETIPGLVYRIRHKAIRVSGLSATGLPTGRFA